MRATELWSEYYAERTAWRCGRGAVSHADHTPRPRDERMIGEGTIINDYALVWLLAQDDARDDGAPELVEHIAAYLDVVLVFLRGRPPLARLFSVFPRWTERDVDRVAAALGPLGEQLKAAQPFMASHLREGVTDLSNYPHHLFRRW